METTNEILNTNLYYDVVAQNVLYWMRVTVACRMSMDGENWALNFANYNSGTYNNQWMVVDYKLYTPGKPLQPNTLWIAEQIPSAVEIDDVTSVLEQNGYWASYNIPYFLPIYKLSGYPAYEAKFGDEYSYTKCARAKIFKRDHGSVTDLDTMKHIMRYNQFQTDPLSLGDACRGVAARCDLNQPWSNNTLVSWSPFGGIDTKVTSDTLIKTQTTMAICGPTWDSQPVFAWTEEWKYYPHFDHPEVFAFSFVNMTSP